METTTKITAGAGAILTILAVVMLAGLLNQENVYVCLDNELAMSCSEGLSKINADGLQTRCKYFSETLNRSTYKNCKSGWLKYEPTITKNNSIDNLDWELCKVIRGNSLIKECVTENNETDLYIVRF